METVQRLLPVSELKNLFYSFIYVYIPDFLMFVVDWVLRNYFVWNLPSFYVILALFLCYHGVLNLWNYLSTPNRQVEQEKCSNGEHKKETETACREQWKNQFKRKAEIAKRRIARRLRVQSHGKSRV